MDPALKKTIIKPLLARYNCPDRYMKVEEKR